MKTITLSGRKRRLSAEDVELLNDFVAEVERTAAAHAKQWHAKPDIAWAFRVVEAMVNFEE